VYGVLRDTAGTQHPVARMGRHVPGALLSSTREDAWTLAEGLLLAAQRQEGLRQVILETVDEASPDAFTRTLRLILQEDLLRFAATLRAACVWFGLNYDVTDVWTVRAHLTQALAYLDDPAAARAAVPSGSGVDAYLEELVVRRELSFNLCWYSPHYDTFEVVPDWARRTLQDHRHDERRDLYTPDELEAAATHDPYWNAAQRQMTATGRMHNYLRMYWGKKVLEWTPDPEQAHATLVRLNDRYEQDGRDPNSYAGIGWVFGLHDRPWTRRPIFGTVRYMNAAGLKRKFDIETYARRWNGPQGDPDPTL